MNISSVREYKYFIASTSANKFHTKLLTDDTLEQLTKNDYSVYEYILDNIKQEDVPKTITKDMIDFIYFSEININSCLILVQYKKLYYLIKDIITNSQTEEIKSIIKISDNFIKITNELSNKDKKLLNIISYDKFKKIKFNYEKANYIPFKENNLYPFDIIYDTEEEIITILDKYISNEKTDSMVFVNMFVLTNNILENIKVYPNIKKLLICNNIRITKFNFIKNFPNLESISLWDMPQIKNENVLIISDTLTEIQFHHCSINLEIFKYLNNMNFKKIVINQSKFTCNINKHQNLLSDEDWANLNYNNLNEIYINSKDLTLETMDYVIRTFKKLNLFVINDIMFDTFKRNTKSGCEPEEIVIQSAFVKENNLTYNRDVKFLNLNKPQEMYSDAFINKMLELGKFKKPTN